MTAFAALLRAVNVGGTGKLAMRDLLTLCERAGFSSPRTYIASGNVVFSSDATEPDVKAKLEEALEAYAGKPVAVFVRTVYELSAILAGNPFRDASPNKVMVLFLDGAPGARDIDAVSGQKNETLHLGKREIYIHYPDGMGRSKLKVPAAAHGTARNINTVAKLASMADEI
ncbi:DUF1697 domain-containing protein [Methyloceanibacter caenitepidi]|uniref:DUF1697 domain-containing protein n=1 Tax=Methyloceanibacter caenitepidi TaxID=1384459 RepID=A0A0A8K2Q0_9HYPH|nr:DUF1697 domain-containing protein [Methyloceanibacter caenitepidi]BAQ17233.1 hypothetical protein GL4_1779 [Methyloceanibacter caenitepidi]